MNEIKGGVDFKFSPDADTTPLRTFRNHKELYLRPDAVWNTLSEQLKEGAVEGWCTTDLQGQVRLPQGLFSIRWVAKKGSVKVRITINAMDLNGRIPDSQVTIKLNTVHKTRGMWEEGDWCLGTDAHSAYYHQLYKPSARKWICFSVLPTELTTIGREILKSKYKHCLHDGRYYFSYVGLVTGCSPSCRQYSDPVNAIMELWQRCPLGAIPNTKTDSEFPLQGERWRGISYIDDAAYMCKDFSNALELACRIVLEYVLLHLHMNIEKSELVPAHFLIFLGVLACTRTLHFSLPVKRCVKIRAAVLQPNALIDPSRGVVQKVSAKVVAGSIGNVWAAHVVAHRAT